MEMIFINVLNVGNFMNKKITIIATIPIIILSTIILCWFFIGMFINFKDDVSHFMGAIFLDLGVVIFTGLALLPLCDMGVFDE